MRKASANLLDDGRVARWLVLMFCLNGWSPVGGQQQPGDLASQSLEALMDVEVTSVSKKEQKVSRTASAVFVITQEDIRQSGATNIPDLLRMVPGMDVAQITSNAWAVSARGLNAQFANELLVMIDGRNVYSPTSGGVFWDTLDVTLENIERIEVIRGPGATVWGGNAVNGVVNIIRKKAGDTPGTLIVAGAGNTNQEFATVEYGARAGKHTTYRIYSKYFNDDNMNDSRGQDGGDGWHLLRGGFRSDTTVSEKDSLIFQGSIYAGREGDPVQVLPSITSSGPVHQQLFANLSGGSLQSIWNHTYTEQSDSTLTASYDTYERSDRLGDKRKTWNLDFQHHFQQGQRQDFVWGLGYRWTAEDSDGSVSVSLIPPSQSTSVVSGFVQDEITVIPDRLYITVGTKLERNTYSGFAALPSARAVYQFNSRRTVWAAISRATRTPSETDVSLRLNVGGFREPDGTNVLISVLGNPRSKDEGAIVYEAGYRAEIGSHLSVDLAAYYNRYDHQDSSEPGTPFFEATPLPPHLVLPVIGQNLIDGETHGLEIAAKWKITGRWTVSPSFDFERIHMHSRPPSQDTETGPSTEGSDPHVHGAIRSHVELPRRLGWDAAAYFTDRLLAQGVPSYTRLDTGLSWRWTDRVTLSVVGQNLLQAQHLEFIDDDGATNSTFIRRSWYGKVTWHF
jgi:iron complex outermembrane receptor protein